MYMDKNDVPVMNITTLDSILCVLDDVAKNTITDDTRNLAIVLMNCNIEALLAKENALKLAPAYAY